MALVNTDDGLLTQGFFKTRFWGKLLGMLSGKSGTSHTHSVKINGTTKTIPATGDTPVDLGTYLTSHQDISGKLDSTGDASNTTSTFTKTSGDTSSMASGSKLSAIFTAISSFFASVASALGGKADKANITGATKCKITYNSQGIVTSGADLGASDIPNLPASKITSGQFGTDRIADDAITADKVKDNETLPVNVSGTAKHLDCYGFWHTYGTGFYDSSKPYAIIGELNLNISGNTGAGQLLQFELDSGIYARVRLDIKWSNGSLQRANVLVIDSSVDYSTLKDCIKITHFTFTSGGNTFLCIRLYVKFTGDWQVWRVRQLDCQTGDCGFTNWADFPLRTGTRSQEASAYGTLVTYKFSYPNASAQVGSPTIPVYVDSNGQVRPCDVLSGGTSNFNKRFTWTYTVNQNDQYITTAVINDNTNYIAEYVEWHNANVGKLTHPPLIILSVSARTNVANAGLISLCMYRNGEGCDVIGEDYTYMGNVHGSSARNTQYFTDRPFYNGEPYYLCIRNETSNPMWTAGTILDIGIRIVAHAVSVT